MKFKAIRRLSEFDKDLKKLLKRFKTLNEDLEVFIDKQLRLYHKLNVDNNGIFPIANLGINNPKIYKSKKFACKALRGKGAKSGIRIIYGYYEEEDIVELIEIYYKGDKMRENKQRIFDYYDSQSIIYSD